MSASSFTEELRGEYFAPLPRLEAPAEPRYSPPPFSPLLRDAVFATTVGLCRAFAALAADVRVAGDGRERLRGAIEGRGAGRALLTVSNHVSVVDDPFVVALAAPPSALLSRSRSRWGWCAQELCFGHWATARFFGSGQLHPVVRGAGLGQPGVGWADDVLARGAWLHLFPEGRCGDVAGIDVQPLRWGVGRLLADCPGGEAVVLPVHHVGMRDVMPLGRLLPRPGHRVTIVVGRPVPYRDLVELHERSVRNNPGWGDPWPPRREDLYAAVTERVGEAMRATAREAEAAHRALY